MLPHTTSLFIGPAFIGPAQCHSIKDALEEAPKLRTVVYVTGGEFDQTKSVPRLLLDKIRFLFVSVVFDSS